MGHLLEELFKKICGTPLYENALSKFADMLEPYPGETPKGKQKSMLVRAADPSVS
jgi:hypothetical protein